MNNGQMRIIAATVGNSVGKPAASRFALVVATLLLLLLTILLRPGTAPASTMKNGLEITPSWVRPDRTVTVTLGPAVDTSAKLFLRLTGRSTVDLPLNAEQAQRRVVEVKIPADMPPDRYASSLVDEQGRDLGVTGSKIKIAISDKPEAKPVISKIVPNVSYQVHGRYAFDIIGENLGSDSKSIKILVNDVALDFDQRLSKRDQEPSSETCDENKSCLISTWAKLQIRGLSLKGRQINRPMLISINIDGIESAPVPLLLSPVSRIVPAIIAFSALGIITLLVYLMYRRKASLYQVNGRHYHTMACLIIDPKTNTFSLSQLQLVLWSAAAIVAYVYLAASRALVQWNWQLCEVPDNLPMLLGISAGTTVLSIGAVGFRGSKGAGPIHPEWGDFISSGGVFAPERFQFFIWTIIGVFSFVSATLAQDPAMVSELPHIPDSFVPLMGISSAGYLAGKVTRKAGPNISRIILLATATGIRVRVIGEYLSPRAQVTLNGTLLHTEEVAPAPTTPPTPADAEFVAELLLTPTSVSLAEADQIDVKIVNPDGQNAEVTRNKQEVTQTKENPAGGSSG